MDAILDFLDANAVLPRYRLASVALLMAGVGPSLAGRLFGWPDWVGLLGLPFDVLLVVLTYKRLRDAALAGAWIWLMVFTFNIGPSWQGFHLGNLINFIPMVMGLIVPADWGDHPGDRLTA